MAEDNEFNVRHLQRLLGKGLIIVRLASNGRKALELAVDGAFDLLLLDLHLPELDGFQVVQAIREREQSTKAHLPVIALTARSRREDRERCLAAGMDDYLAKPIRTVDLFAAIDRVVSAHGGTRPAPTHDGDQTRLLDPVVLLASCGDDPECLRELCQDFQIYAPARLAEVCDALRSQNAARLRETAHKLCGLLSAFSTMAGNLASDLEDHAARGELDQARPLVERLEPMVHRLVRQVDGLTYESLQQQAGSADDRDRTDGA